MPKLSIIIPVYSTVACLPACLDAILSQIEVDLEAICVDDASTDSSLELFR